MDKKELLRSIKLKRDEGLSDREIFDALMPQASKIWSSEEVVFFIYQVPSKALREKYKSRNYIILGLIGAAYFLRISFLGFQSLETTSQISDNMAWLIILLPFVVFTGVALYVANDIRNFKRNGYIFAGLISTYGIFKVMTEYGQVVLMGEANFIFSIALLSYGGILVAIAWNVKNSLDTFWPEINWKGQFKHQDQN